jgi:hypothetical protein
LVQPFSIRGRDEFIGPDLDKELSAEKSVGNRVYSCLGSQSASVQLPINLVLERVTVIMAQILDPIPSNSSGHALCCYVNATSQIQIARITNVPNWYFERVVFPGQRLIFEAVPEAQLEIHTGMMASAILSDTIPCSTLCLQSAQEIQSELTASTVLSSVE